MGDSMAKIASFMCHNNTYQLADSFSMVKGRQTFKVGVDLRKFQLNLTSEGSQQRKVRLRGRKPVTISPTICSVRPIIHPGQPGSN